MAADAPCVYVDFAGNAAFRKALHSHCKNLKFSSSIGGTHVSDLGSGKDLPGPKPTLFFAPAQIKKRSAEWGSQGLGQRLLQSWHGFIAAVSNPGQPWLTVQHHTGPGGGARRPTCRCCRARATHAWGTCSACEPAVPRQTPGAAWLSFGPAERSNSAKRQRPAEKVTLVGVRSRGAPESRAAPALSTPSAITVRPRLWPSATMVRAMAASLGSVSTSRTKRLVDLELVQRQALEVGQRRVAGAKVVQRKAHAVRLEGAHLLDHVFHIVHQQALGQLQLEAARVGAGLLQQPRAPAPRNRPGETGVR